MHDSYRDTYTKIELGNGVFRREMEAVHGKLDGTHICIPHIWVRPDQLVAGERSLRARGLIFAETPPPFRRLFVPYDTATKREEIDP